MNQFLAKYGYASPELIAQDGSARCYYRVYAGAKTAVLMEVLEGASETLDKFEKNSKWLRSIGLSAPELYARDGSYALIEDFGSTPFKAVPDYDLAIQVLDHMQSADCPLNLPNFKDSRAYKGRVFVLDYYLPAALGCTVTADEITQYNAIWSRIENALPPAKQSIIHGDYHVENLMLLPEREGIKRCGIIDFEGMMRGNSAYDLANLLWDMRVDVTEQTRQQILERYDDQTQAWAHALALQFHCRLVGQCIRWAVVTDKPQYLEYLPRIYGYLNQLLQRPEFSELRKYFSNIGLDFSAPQALDIEAARSLIRAQAF